MSDIVPPERFNGITRREFLKLSGAAFLSLFFNQLDEPFTHAVQAQSDEQVLPSGRVVGSSANILDSPSLSGKLVRVAGRDNVLPITRATIGDEEPGYNRVWYEVNHEGYIHSGSLQPVEEILNAALTEIPKEGQLVTVTVPYTDSVWNPKYPNYTHYRLYFGSVYWAKAIRQDKDGKFWYHIPDDKFGISYFARAEHLRPILADELALLSPQVPAEAKRLEVRLKEQVVIAYENDVAVFMSRVATGGKFKSGNFQTPIGRYLTNRKRPSRHMTDGDRAAAASYDLPGIPWVSYLTSYGIAFHGTYWHNDFGKPRSHGCINCSNAAARWIYRWTAPHVPTGEATWEEEEGTIVDVVA